MLCKVHRSKTAIAFEQDVITSIDTFTFARHQHLTKLIAFEDEQNRCSILLCDDELRMLRDYINESLGETSKQD